MTKQRINLAVVGTGNWARRYHFPALDALAHNPVLVTDPAFEVDLRLAGVFSLEPTVAAQVADDVGFERVYDSLDALIDDEAVTAVAVLVPPEAAHDVIMRVAAKGVPLLSEKPPGISTTQATSLAQKVTVPNVLAFNRRYAPLNNRFKALVDDLETITYVEGQFFRYSRAEPEFMIGTAIHWINFMEYVCGEIEDVTAERIAGPGDTATYRFAQLTFANSVSGQLQVLPCTGSDVERLTVHTASRTLYLYGPRGDQPGRIIVHDRATEEIIDPEARIPLPETVRLGIVGEYIEFLTKACRGQPTRSNFRNAVNSMRVAEALEV